MASHEMQEANNWVIMAYTRTTYEDVVCKLGRQALFIYWSIPPSLIEVIVEKCEHQSQEKEQGKGNGKG